MGLKYLREQFAGRSVELEEPVVGGGNNEMVGGGWGVKESTRRVYEPPRGFHRGGDRRDVNPHHLQLSQQSTGAVRSRAIGWFCHKGQTVINRPGKGTCCGNKKFNSSIVL